MMDQASIELPALVRENLRQWDVPKDADIALLTISENATFVIKWAMTKRIIRVYRPHYHTNSEILSELLWLQAIEQSGIVPVPHLFHSNTGELFVEDKSLRLACFSFIEGHEPRTDNDLVRWFTLLGNISARLHQQSMGWKKPKDFTRKHWTYETMLGKNASWGNWQNVNGLSPADRKILEQCDATLKHISRAFPKDEAHFGLIHGDLRLANLLVKGKNLAAIDFDDCGFSWFGLDLANSLSFIEDHPLVPALIDAWFQGYGQVMPVKDDVKDMVPHLMMMRRMQLTAWLTTHNTTPTAKKLGASFPVGTVKLAKTYLEMFNPLGVR